MSPHKLIESSWRPFDITEYRLKTALTSAQRKALGSSHSRAGVLQMNPVPDLIRQLMGIAAGSGCVCNITGLVIARLLPEMRQADMRSWCWPQKGWQTLCWEVREAPQAFVKPVAAVVKKFRRHLAG